MLPEVPCELVVSHVLLPLSILVQRTSSPSYKSRMVSSILPVALAQSRVSKQSSWPCHSQNLIANRSASCITNLKRTGFPASGETSLPFFQLTCC